MKFSLNGDDEFPFHLAVTHFEPLNGLSEEGTCLITRESATMRLELSLSLSLSSEWHSKRARCPDQTMRCFCHGIKPQRAVL